MRYRKRRRGARSRRQGDRLRSDRPAGAARLFPDPHAPRQRRDPAFGSAPAGGYAGRNRKAEAEGIAED